MGGEHVHFLMVAVNPDGRSPRGRGTRDGERWHGSDDREIPAWAGNTSPACWLTRITSGDPRVGGEHLAIFSIAFMPNGRSPRGRGTHQR